jgi:uroporphyrinogen decarboxylase
VPLIGFSGAPFTLASYIIEGGGSRNYVHAKGLMYGEPKLWHILMDKITEIIKRYLAAQIKAGVQAVQLFDSWVGCLGPDEYKEFVLPYTKRVIDSVKDVPVINFSTNTSSYLDTIRSAGGDVISVDWRIPLDKAWDIIGHDVAIQGNIDPVILFTNPKEIRKRAKDIIDRAGGRPGHIFNLGHGIIVETPVDNVRALIDCVHEFTQTV